MYLKKIVLENFQGFERGEFNLSPNLNILVGVSNVGKSSVARALSLVLYNQWDKSWCRYGAKFCRITLETSTGLVIIREKGDKVNRYILRSPDSPEQLFESFGTSTPEQIQQVLKIHEVQIDTTDKLNLNLAGQMDALFLLSQTGSYRAKVLGKLSGATYLDHAIRELNKDKRRITAEKDAKDLETGELKGQVDKFEGLESFSGTISALESRLSDLVRSQERIEQIRSLLERVKTLRDSWTREHAKAEILGTFDLSLIEQLPPKVNKIQAISLLLGKIVSFKQTFLKENKLNELLNTIDLSGITKMADKAQHLTVIKDFSERFCKNKIQLVVMTNELLGSEAKYKETAELYTMLLRDNGVCPTCDQATNHLCVQ
jgi:exonuclease SbcC